MRLDPIRIYELFQWVGNYDDGAKYCRRILTSLQKSCAFVQ